MTCTTDCATNDERCCSSAVLSCTKTSFGAIASKGAIAPGWRSGLINHGRLDAMATARQTSKTTAVCNRVQRNNRRVGD